MDASVLSDDSTDGFDIVSLPGSVAGFTGAPLTIVEPPPLAAAQDAFNTVQLSAQDCMILSSQALGIDTTKKTQTQRVYVDGIFAGLSVRDALQLRQIKLSFPAVHLVAGVFSDAMCGLFGVSAIAPQLERAEALRHCRWIDEVLAEDAPCPLDAAFVAKHRFDYVAVEEGATVDPTYHKLRLQGYDEMKRGGIVLSTRRTTGTVNIPPALRTPEQHILDEDIYGIGI
uniref:Uncharacterized protein n=1 Tax=Mycena chlorophos TaxID=658473 RepID=A0ABQ0L6E4_MYCCL|nr:predicted protein [Mycena chlorophos]